MELITGDKDPVGQIGDGSDTHAFSSFERTAKAAEEAEALKDFAKGLRPSARSEFESLLEEVIFEETVEAKFVKAIDKLQALTFVRIKKVGVHAALGAAPLGTFPSEIPCRAVNQASTPPFFTPMLVAVRWAFR